MFVPRLTVPAALAALAGTVSVAAQGTSSQGLSVLVPGGPNLWWVAQSINTLAWTCHTTTVTNFTVLIGNSNPSVMSAAQAILAQEPTFDCSKTITADNFGQAPGTGYFVQLANPFNNTDIYAQSDEFEIKAVGSAYPDPSSTPTGVVGGPTPTASGGGNSSSSTQLSSGSSTATSQTTTPTKNAAVGTKASLTGLAAVAAAAFGIILA